MTTMRAVRTRSDQDVQALDSVETYQAHAVAVGAWQCTMDMCECENLDNVLQGEHLFHYFTNYLKFFGAELDLESRLRNGMPDYEPVTELGELL